MALLYIDGTTLSNSTAVYTDAALTNCAPAAFYSDGTVSREQVFVGNSCQLLPPQLCPSCATPCGSQISGSGGVGVYKLSIDTGGTATDTGAIVVKFNPQSVPDGVQAVYDGTLYNKLSSPQFGLLQSSTAGVPTYVGNTGSQGDCQSGSIEGTYSNVSVLEYNGSSFVSTGAVETIVIDSTQNALTAGPPGVCVMVIPKPNPSPTVVDVEAIGVCTSTAWSITIDCPVAIPKLLAGYNSSVEQACNEILDEYVYHVPVNSNSSQNNVNIHDFIFADQNGAVSVNNGWYLHPTGYIYEVQSGVVTDKKSGFCNSITVTDCITGDSWTMNNRFGSNVVGEVIQYKRINAVTQVVEPEIFCGTIIDLGFVSTNAQQVSPISRACDDTVHCP